MRLPSLLAVSISCSVILAGCSSVPVDRTFGRVRSTVADRVASPPEWPTSADARRQLEERLAATLSQPLNMERAVAIALINNRDLRAEYACLGFAEADFIEAGLLDNPGLTVGVGFPDRAPSVSALDAGLTLNILQWLITPARKQIATVRLDAEVLSVADAVLRTATETRLLFLRLQAAESMSSLLAQTATAAEASYELAKRMYDAGNLSDLTLATQQSLYEQLRVEYARSLADVADLREQLNAQLGLWGPQTQWEIEGNLPPLPAFEPDLGELESLAIRQRLDLAASAKEVEAISKAAGLQRDCRYLLVAAFGVNAARDTDGQWVFGPQLALEVPVFDRGQARIARLDAALLAAQARLEGLAIRTRADVRRLRNRLFAARYEAEHYRDAILPLRERIDSLTREQSNFMLADPFDLLAGKRESIAAYRAYLDSIRNYWEVRVLLEQAVGGRLPEPPREPVPDEAARPQDPMKHTGDDEAMPGMHHNGGH